MPEIYSTLTKDTIPPPKNDTLPKRNAANNILQRTLNNSSNTQTADTTRPVITDTTEQQVDTFSFKISKDTLDAPVHYEADSAVIMAQSKKILLYGKTKTTYQDIVLESPQVELDQQTSLVTAVGEKDSTGAIIQRARFEQGENKFESDNIQFNFKTQKGLTKNTFTHQSEMFVQGETIKKINNSTFFVRRGRFTTCDLDDPHFAFVSNKLKVINNKVAVSGPTHPEFESVPIPIYLPFGYFPLSRGRHSGFLPPQFTTNEAFGLGLEGLGYYKVLNDNFDVALRGNIYSYGGWSANLTPTYRKRYRYNGGLNLAIQRTKFNFKGDPDYNLSKTFFVTWNHTVDQRARPGTNFSANVNAGSTKFNRLVPNNVQRNVQNNLASSIAYSKTWAGKPYNLTLSANHSQNDNNRLINITLPDAGFTVTTIFPFQRKEAVGTPKWYEKLGIGYNGVLRNQVAFYDTAKLSFRQLADTLQWGAQHRIPISVALPPIGAFQVAPTISYEETWLTQRMRRRWDNVKRQVDTVEMEKGLFTDRQMTFGMGVSTALFGTVQFKKSRLVALRHVVRPNLSFNYKPNLSRRNFDVIQIDTFGTKAPIPKLQGSLFNGYSYGKFAGISFGIDNNLEMKWRSKGDSGTTEIKKVRLIDGFGFSSSYNFMADSLSPKLQPFNLYLRSTLFEKINLTATALVDPYQTDKKTGRSNYNRFVWQENRFSPGRLTGASVAISTDFKSKPRDGAQASDAPNPANQIITDPLLMGDQQRLLDYMRRNPAEFVDFNIPWSISLAYSLSYSQQLAPDLSFKPVFFSSLNFNGSFSLTPKWNITGNGFYDFDTKTLQTFTLAISREMHCWQMSIGVTPLGDFRYYNFTISPKASMLQDLRVNRTRTFVNY